jgi:streptogrisin C
VLDGFTAEPPTPPTSCAAQSFTAARQSAYPAGASFTAAGTHKGCLTGAAGTDFDLYLER